MMIATSCSGTPKIAMYMAQSQIPSANKVPIQINNLTRLRPLLKAVSTQELENVTPK
jgi:hypothetical protein